MFGLSCRRLGNPGPGRSAAPASALYFGVKGSSLKVSLSILPVNLNGTS